MQHDEDSAELKQVHSIVRVQKTVHRRVIERNEMSVE